MTDRAGRWLRASTKRQNERAQEPEIDEWIESHGYEAVKTYRTRASAFHGRHEPELQEAMDDLKCKRTDVLVVWKADRLDRQKRLPELMREAVSYGGRIEFVVDHDLNVLSGLGGDMIQTFKSWQAHDESLTKAERTRLHQGRSVRIGSWAGGKPPTGLTAHDTGKHAEGAKILTLIPNTDAPRVTEAFEMIAEGRSYSEVQESTGLRDVSRIIRNKAYRGVVERDGVTYMTIEPLVPSELWLRANQDLNGRSNSKGWRARSGRPSPRLLRPVCPSGHPMYHYDGWYRCVKCSIGIRVTVLDAEVTAAFESADDPEIVDTWIPGTDYAEEIAQTSLALRDLDLDADDYDTLHAVLRAELKRLKALPSTPGRMESEYTGRKEGDAFKGMGFEERKAFIRQWAVVVSPDGSWSLSRPERAEKSSEPFPWRK